VTAVGRLFVALDLPVSVGDALAAWARREVGARDDLRRVPVDALHLTLLFLGDRPMTDVDVIASAMRSTADGPVPLGVGAPLWLAPRRPHVLAVGITDPAGALTALHRRLQARLGTSIGWDPERRAFRPHVTVARVRRGAQVRPIALDGPEDLRWWAEALTLYRSRLGGGPARYEVLARVALPEPG
jgi:2'-5' RNA ligase